MSVIAMQGGLMAANAGVVDGYPSLLSMTSNTDGTVVTHSVTLPITANGDLLVIVFGRGGSARTVEMPSPWVDAVASSNAEADTRAFYLTCDGTESGATLSVSTEGSARPLAWSIFRFAAGTWSGVPVASRSAVVTSAAPNPPSLSPSWGSAKTFWIAACTCRQGGLPTGYPFLDGQVTQANGPDGFASCWSKQESATVDPSAFTLSASASHTAATVAIRPA